MLIIPIIIAQYLVDLTLTQNLIISAADWAIYSIFLTEFLLKILIAKNKKSFLKSNKLYAITSIVIILSPLLEPVSELFAAAPILRALRIVNVIRLSRLTRLAAVSGRAKISWQRINFRTYAIVTAIVAFGFFISFFRPEVSLSPNDQGSFSQFVQMTGTIYAIVTGFVISNVWNKYTNLVNAIKNEVSTMRNCYLIVIQLQVPAFIGILKRNLLNYNDLVIDVYWKGVKNSNLLTDEATNVFTSIKQYTPKTAQEVELYSNYVDELRKSSEYRTNINSLVSSKTPRILWALLMVLSSILIVGFYLVQYENQFLATFTITMIATAIALVAVIIYDMDDPFKFGFWAITPKAYIELTEFLQKHRTYSSVVPNNN